MIPSIEHPTNQPNFSVVDTERGTIWFSFSVPASVSVKGKTVSGYVTVATVSGSDVATDDDPSVVYFRAYNYGRNGSLLPNEVRS